MNFSTAVKEEIIMRPPKSACCRAAYFRGFFMNTAKTPSGMAVLSLSTLLARKEAVRLLHGAYRKEPLLQGNTVCFPGDKLLRDLEAPLKLTCEHCAEQLLRGAFVASGSVTDPQKKYLLEIFLYEREAAEQLLPLFIEGKNVKWRPKLRAFRDGYMVYVSCGEAVEDMLASFGAHNAVFDVVNTRITRGIRNEENRATNCVAINIGKTVNAATRTLAAIERIRAASQLEMLPVELRETARLREENPSVSLFDLALLHNPPLTKSGLNHRLQKIIAFADTLANAPKEEK